MVWNAVVDGNIIAALQEDTTKTVVRQQLQEGKAQLPDDAWEVSNLVAPDKRTRDTTKMGTVKPAPQRD